MCNWSSDGSSGRLESSTNPFANTLTNTLFISRVSDRHVNIHLDETMEMELAL